MESLGKTLASLRKRKGISQELLAENSKVSLRTIQRIERDLTVPRPHTLKVIADALNVPIENLIHNQPEAFKKDDVDNLLLINVSALTVCLVPFANLIFPMIIWKKKNGSAFVDQVGRRIINFQILWSIVTVIVVPASHILVRGLTGSVAIGKLPPTFFLAYAAMIIVNILYVLHASIRLKNHSGPEALYPIAPSFF
jgi:XRE family transcriptional regulator, regulator of sulfur utilization